MTKTLLGGAAAIALLSTPALAQDFAPALSGEVSFELQHDFVSDADDGSLQGHDTYATIEPALTLTLMEGLRVEAGLTLEPVQDRDPDNNRLLDDHGLYVDTLQVVYDVGPVTVNAGKFTAPFGLAHDAIPGLYGDTFSEGYELTERLGAGIGGAFSVPDAATFTLGAALFKRDTSVLSRSIITDRGDLDYDDGGSGNTKGLGSFSLTGAVSDLAAAPGLTLQVSYLDQAKGSGETGDTSAVAIGATWAWQLGEDVTVTPLVEYVSATDAIAVNEATYIDGATQSTWTAGLGFEMGAWSAAVTGGKRTVHELGNAHVRDDFMQLSAGYAFDNGIGVEAGWMTLEEGGENSTTLGAMVSYGIEF